MSRDERAERGAACGARYSFGCGHTPEQESAHLDHEQTTEHLLGDCDCYVSRAGYAAFVSREERREQVADVLRRLVPAARQQARANWGQPSGVYVRALDDLRDALPTGRGWQVD